MSKYKIALVKGDGIGPEVSESAVDVIRTALQGSKSQLTFEEWPAGAEHYQKTGVSFPDSTFEACAAADAILHGAAGHPSVKYPDGTEAGLDFGLQLRFRLDLYANIRPIKLLPGVNSRLDDGHLAGIDYVILRENTEGLYAARGGGNLLRGEVVSDTILMTRKGIERIVRYAFELSRKRGRGAPADGRMRVTCCDKANVLKSYAFWRKVFDEVAADYADVESDYALVDAMTSHMVTNPDRFDVVVTENMFGDIISDLGSATVGSMGMSPSAELGDSHGFFQASHGSAPDIAGKGIANPIGTILAGSMMLDWLGDRNGDAALTEAGSRIEQSVLKVLAEDKLLPMDLGGKATTADITQAVCRQLSALSLS